MEKARLHLLATPRMSAALPAKSSGMNEYCTECRKRVAVIQSLERKALRKEDLADETNEMVRTSGSGCRGSFGRAQPGRGRQEGGEHRYFENSGSHRSGGH